MAQDLSGTKVAILVADGFEQIEMTQPREALESAGADTVLISPKESEVRGWQKTDWGDSFQVDIPLGQADAEAFDALFLPGGQINPDLLRLEPRAVQMVRDFVAAHKPVAAICHGPWMLAEADVLRGRTITSYPSIRTDMINAGANWVDKEVVVDSGLVTSRSPADLSAFCDKLIEEVAEGRHRGQRIPEQASERPSPRLH